MISISPTALLLALLMLGHQQQVAQAWWLFPEAPAPKSPSTAAPAAYGGQGQGEAPAQAQAQAPMKAVARFDMDGVKGTMSFSQASASAPTQVEYELNGLKGNNQLYHVHVRPVPKFDAELVKNNATARAQLCGDPATGGHLNPHHVTQKLPPKSAPLDKYETGDLSGKHGPLTLDPTRADHYKGSFSDDKLPMSGENSIVGRSIVIHKNGGARWVCATIERQ